MIANAASEERQLVDGAIAALSKDLPASWQVRRSSRTVVGTGSDQQSLADDLIEIAAGPNGVTAALVVEAKRLFGPRDVERLSGDRLFRVLRLNYNLPVLVVSEWLSPRSRELMEQQGINYLDLTGNALVRLDNPAVLIRSSGAARSPKPLERGKVRLRGPKAARVLRLLLDVRPPYGVRELAMACGVAGSYVSRLLDALDTEALIDRSSGGRVGSVDIPRLLRRWAETYDVFTTNQAATFLAPAGATATLDRLRSDGDVARHSAITGSFAAVRLAPVAAPALLTAYTDNTDVLAAELGLLPADEGANVALLGPYDAVVWARTTIEDGVRWASPSQVAVDCLTGNGRMPAEGEALIRWMAKNEDRWRLGALAEVTPLGTT
ncbi:MAG: hypothetical protein ACLP7F_00515 [Acidimicrobiales bacterium]